MYHFQVIYKHFPLHTYSCHQSHIVFKETAALWKYLVSFLNGTAAILKWRFQGAALGFKKSSCFSHVEISFENKVCMQSKTPTHNSKVEISEKGEHFIRETRTCVEIENP